MLPKGSQELLWGRNKANWEGKGAGDGGSTGHRAPSLSRKHCFPTPPPGGWQNLHHITMSCSATEKHLDQSNWQTSVLRVCFPRGRQASWRTVPAHGCADVQKGLTYTTVLVFAIWCKGENPNSNFSLSVWSCFENGKPTEMQSTRPCPSHLNYPELLTVWHLWFVLCVCVFSFFQIIICMITLPACMCVYQVCAWCPQGQKKGSDPLELELPCGFWASNPGPLPRRAQSTYPQNQLTHNLWGSRFYAQHNKIGILTYNLNITIILKRKYSFFFKSNTESILFPKVFGNFGPRIHSGLHIWLCCLLTLSY